MLKISMILLSFVVGSIPFGYIIGKLKGIDVREHGSGNVGATNVARVAGKRYGLIVLVLDALKGILPVLLARLLLFSVFDTLLVALLCILGHCFSPFLGFKGGKGVATSFGAFLVVSPTITMLSFLIFLIVFFTTRFVSLGSIFAVISYVILFYFFKSPNFSSDLIVIICAMLIIVRHKSNIYRLLNEKELKFK